MNKIITLTRLLLVINFTFAINTALAANSTSVHYEVVDFLGRKVQLKQPAKRIVALAPHIVENLFSAGAGDKIVGAVDYCDYPEAAKKIPRVGAISTYSLEGIIQLNPDLVIVWHSGHGGKILKKLVALGIPAYASDPRSLPDIAKAIKDFGILAGTRITAKKSAHSFQRRYQSLTNNFSDADTVNTLYQVWNAPLQTINDKSIISDVIRLCGGKNAFGDAIPIAPKISIESVIARNPEVIIASGMGKSRPEWLDAWQQWPTIEAVKSKNLYFIPPDIIQRHTMRILEGAEQMCEHLKKARNKRKSTH